MFASFRKFVAPAVKSRKSSAGIASMPPVCPRAPAEAPVLVSMDVMDAAFDRSAGRFCAVCDVHGSHHTESHNQFAAFALALAGQGAK